MTARTRVVVADGSRSFASSLALALDGDPQLEVVGSATTGEETLVAVTTLRPDLLLVDLDLDGPRAALRVCRVVGDDHPDTTVLVLVADEVDEHLLAVLETGVAGFVSRTSGLDEARRTMEAALRGEACVPRRMLGGLLRELVQRRREVGVVQQRYATLSRREQEVFGLLGSGLDHRDIARELVLSPATVRTHIQNVMSKMQVHSRMEAAALAVEHGYAAERMETR